MKGKEIELKYIVKTIPKITPLEVKRVIQYYTKVDETEEVRYRSVKCEKFYRTEKSGNGLVREEKEIEISEEEFEKNKEQRVGQEVQKLRCIIPYNVLGKEYRIELDVYEGDLSGLVVAEIEFNSVIESKLFKVIKPFWLGKDVTEDSSYKNKNLAIRG